MPSHRPKMNRSETANDVPEPGRLQHPFDELSKNWGKWAANGEIICRLEILTGTQGHIQELASLAGNVTRASSLSLFPTEKHAYESAPDSGGRHADREFSNKRRKLFGIVILCLPRW